MNKGPVFLMSLLMCVCCAVNFCYAQEESVPPAASAPEQAAEQMQEMAEGEVAITDDLQPAERVTLDFKDADIRNVLKIISMKAGVNIVTTPDVIGNVTVRLVDVPWDKALDVILKINGFGYDKQGNIIMVAPIEKLTTLKRQEVELAQVQPILTEVFTLKYLDAQDAQKAIEPQLSPRGKITILEMTGQAGWEFGGETLGKRRRLVEERMSRSKVLIVSDIQPVLDKLKEVIAGIDTLPSQVLIEARIMEASRDKLRDLGFDFGTGSNGATTSTITGTPILDNGQHTLGSNLLGSQVSPAGFGQKASGITGSEPFNTGFNFLWQKLTGTQFEILIHALEEDVNVNTLSAPRILALNNQEATILVGTRYPILKQDTTATSSSASVTTVSLDYYQDIGIQLNVVPQVGSDNTINMIVHPAVTAYTQTLGGSGDIAQYPIIETREAETRIFMNDGDTVVIGGLLKEVKTKNRQGVPILSSIPFLGWFFSRDTHDTAKIDLLIFITARVVKEGDYSPEEIEKLEKRLDDIYNETRSVFQE